MDGFIHRNVYGIDDSLSVLQYYPPYLKKYAEGLDHVISQLRKSYINELFQREARVITYIPPGYTVRLSADDCVLYRQMIGNEKDARSRRIAEIERLNRLLNKSETEKTSLEYYLRQSEKAKEHYRRERDQERKFLWHFDELRHVRGLDKHIDGLKQELEKVRRDKDAEIKRYKVSCDDVIYRNQRIQQDLIDKTRQQTLKIQDLEGQLNKQTYKPSQERSSSPATKEKDQQLILHLRQQLQQTFEKLKDAQTELDETKTRLSKVAGDRLVDNNPNITDLSDKNRPLKLAERFSELYDNQWTDALQVLNKYFKEEEQAIRALLEILQDAMLFCKTTGKTQMENLQRDLALSDSREEIYAPASMLKQLKDCRKATVSLALTNLQKMYTSRIKQSSNQTLKTALEITPFIHECVEICWLMVIQDPSVVFAPTVARGSELDRDLYKLYTVNGPYVDFVVWPPLLLHQDGPVLAKGVAQGYHRQERKLDVSSRKFDDSKEQGYNDDAQTGKYRHGYSNSARIDRDSKNGNDIRDDRSRNQQVATVGPIQVHSSRT